MTNNQYRPYRKVLSTSQKRIKAGIEQVRSALSHAAEKGSLIENIIRVELEQLLPYQIGVAHGFVTDSNGQNSRQMDIILYDKLTTPRIFSSPGAQIFPVEATYACGEIKTRLDSNELRDVFEKCCSYKKLERKSYFDEAGLIKTTYRLFGKENEHWQSIFFCIAVESMEKETILQGYQSLVTEKNLDHTKRIDHICGLDGKSFLYSNKPLLSGIPQDRSIDLLPEGAESSICSYLSNEPWALFINLLLTCMTQVEHPKIRMLDYDDHSPF